MTKSDLKTGMFGVMDDGDWFVIVDDTIVYENGMFDTIDRISDDLCYETYKIERLYKLKYHGGFNSVKFGLYSPIYDRRKQESVEMTIPEIEKALGITNLKIKK